eukprot:15040219-Heterocapsa_arctica.AAC.1
MRGHVGDLLVQYPRPVHRDEDPDAQRDFALRSRLWLKTRVKKERLRFRLLLCNFLHGSEAPLGLHA